MRIWGIFTPILKCRRNAKPNGVAAPSNRINCITICEFVRFYAKRYKVQIRTSRHESNHIHLIAVPSNPEALARTLGRTHADFARHFNFRRRSCGHVWQARFFSCPLNQAHLWQAMAYVERNPVRARIVAEAHQYRWSGAKAHVGDGQDDSPLDLAAWRREYDPQRWRKVLNTSVGEEALGKRIHQAVLSGRPLGDELFLKSVEAKSGRVLSLRPGGRPKSNRREHSDQLSLALGV